MNHTVSVSPYINFNGRCEEAINFYQKAIGAKLIMSLRFKDCPDKQMLAQMPPSHLDKIMHSTLQVGDTQFFASDGRCMENETFQNVSLSISVPTEAEADKTFAALSAGGKVEMPMTKTFFSPKFGMVKDKFGLCWMIITSPQA